MEEGLWNNWVGFSGETSYVMYGVRVIIEETRREGDESYQGK